MVSFAAILFIQCLSVLYRIGLAKCQRTFDGLQGITYSAKQKFEDGECTQISPAYYNSPEAFLSRVLAHVKVTSSRGLYPKKLQPLPDRVLPYNFLILTFSNGESCQHNLYKLRYLLDTSPYVVVNVFSQTYHDTYVDKSGKTDESTLLTELPDSIEKFLRNLLKIVGGEEYPDVFTKRVLSFQTNYR